MTTLAEILAVGGMLPVLVEGVVGEQADVVVGRHRVHVEDGGRATQLDDVARLEQLLGGDEL